MTGIELLNPEFMKKLRRLQIVTKKIFTGRMKGERRSKKRGISTEFADYRNYSKGDDVRFIDWNIYGRLERLFLKLFMEEEDLYFYTLIDSSKSMDFGEPTKFDLARKIAAALSYIGLIGLDKVAIASFDTDITLFQRPTRGKQNFWKILRFLEELECTGETSLLTTANNFTLQNKMRGIVVLLSDLMDPEGFEEALKCFLNRRFELYLVHILSDEEVEPELDGHLELVDSEYLTRTHVSVTEPLLRNYKKTLNAFCESVRHFCVARNVTYLQVRSSDNVEQFILAYLKKIGLLK